MFLSAWISYIFLLRMWTVVNVRCRDSAFKECAPEQQWQQNTIIMREKKYGDKIYSCFVSHR